MTRTGYKRWLAVGAVVLSLLVALYIVSGCHQETKVSTASEKPAAKAGSAAKELTKDERMGWWRDARFGMFIHWGLYAVPAGKCKGERVDGIGEWIMNNGKIPVAEYEKFAGQFNPVEFDAERVGPHRQERGHEVHRHHEQASRRLLPVGLEGHATTTSWTPRRSSGTSSRSWRRPARSKA